MLCPVLSSPALLSSSSPAVLFPISSMRKVRGALKANKGLGSQVTETSPPGNKTTLGQPHTMLSGLPGLVLVRASQRFPSQLPGLLQAVAFAGGCPQPALWMGSRGCGTRRITWIREGQPLAWLLSCLSLLMPIPWLHVPPRVRSLPFYLLPSAPLPSALLLRCLTFVPSAPLCRSHPFYSMLSIWAIFSCRDPLSAGALSLLLFCFLLPLLCPPHPFHAPFCYLPSAAQLQFLLCQLLPNLSPLGPILFCRAAFHCPIFSFLILFRFPHPLLVVPSTAATALLPFPTPTPLFSRVPLQLPTCLFPSSLCLSVPLSSSLFVLCFFLHWPPLLPREGGFILMQSCKGRVVPRAPLIPLTSFLPAAFALFMHSLKSTQTAALHPHLCIMGPIRSPLHSTGVFPWLGSPLGARAVVTPAHRGTPNSVSR